MESRIQTQRICRDCHVSPRFEFQSCHLLTEIWVKHSTPLSLSSILYKTRWIPFLQWDLETTRVWYTHLAQYLAFSMYSVNYASYSVKRLLLEWIVALKSPIFVNPRLVSWVTTQSVTHRVTSWCRKEGTHLPPIQSQMCTRWTVSQGDQPFVYQLFSLLRSLLGSGIKRTGPVFFGVGSSGWWQT